MKEITELINDELMERFCTKTGLPETAYVHMVGDWIMIDETVRQFGRLLVAHEASKQPRYKLLLEREYRSLCNMMTTFEQRYRIKCSPDVPSAIREYEPPESI